MSNTPQEVQEEARLLETVLANLARLRGREGTPDYNRDLLELREALAEERLPEDMASVVESMDRAAALRAHQSRSQSGKVDPGNPYFGHLVVDDDHGRRSILIGRQTFLSDRVRIVDWRNAPISKIFYQCHEGDEYEATFAEREISGEVVTRRILAVSGGELERVGTSERTWVRGDGGEWTDLRSQEARLAGGAQKALRASSLGTGAGGGRRDRHLPAIASLLDPEQFRLITQPEAGLVVIEGSAGSGKTTVGLHRIAYLHFQNPGRYAGRRLLVMVFSRALASYISQVLPALGVDDVQVQVYERWAERLRKAHFPGLPDRYADDTPAAVTRFKTHPALLRMVDAVGHRRRGQRPRTVFEEMLTDRRLVASGLARWAPGEFSEDQLAKIHRWCTDRHYVRADGEGLHQDDRPNLDREDDTILLRLHQVMVGPLESKRRRPLVYPHVMVDEAQDLCPMELAVIIGTASDDRSVTLAGDVAQSIAEHRDVQNWKEVLSALDLDHVAVSPLQVSYRATRQIMEVAHDILGPLAPGDLVTTVREGAPVGHLRFDGMGQAVAWMADALADLAVREPTAYVALLAANLSEARDWHDALERADIQDLHLVADQDFSFAPGIDVSDIRSAKGLEFDYVILLGADADRFGSDDASRHLLHVGATRAAHQLWFVSTGLPSPLIPEGLRGLLDQAPR